MDLTMASHHSNDHMKFNNAAYSAVENDHEISSVLGMEMEECKHNKILDEMNHSQEHESPSIEQGFIDGLEWKDGIGILPGSNLKFRMNEFGIADLITDEIPENPECEDPDVLREHSDSDCDESIVEVKGQENLVIKIKKDGNNLGPEEKPPRKEERKPTQVDYVSVIKVESSNNNFIKNEDTSIECISQETLGLNQNMTNGKSTETMTNVQVKTCPICGVQGRPEFFLGRFCTSKCRARNATMHRRSHPGYKKAAKSHSHPLSNEKRKLSSEMTEKYAGKRKAVDEPSVVKERSSRRTSDLKIRIRLSSSPPADKTTSQSRSVTSNFTSGTPFHRSRRKRFVWSQYLTEENANVAPPGIFQEVTGKKPFPGENGIKRGMALEGIDPKHQSLFCPLSVASVIGYRIRLHFCGFSESYDFWADADSPLLFPCGYCHKTGRKLEPMKGYTSNSFSWEMCMKKNNLYPAPDNLFSSITEVKECGFKAGVKLEAVDKYNPELVCVATVNDVIGDNVLIHFDGWTHDFDYWCPSSSYLIHPVGWCEKEGKQLTPPEGYDDINFSWSEYLKETKSNAANETWFKKKEKHKFEPGMKLEVVDVKNPVLVRVATISEIDGSRILIHFDGWNEVYDFWTDSESPDLHPAGWCNKTNYQLQPPISPEDLVTTPGQGGCPIPGCIGVGHVKGAKFVGHHSEYGCPYSPQNLQRECLNDRLSNARYSSSTQDFNFNANSDTEASQTQLNLRDSTTQSSQVLEMSDSASNSPKEKAVISSSELNSMVDEKGKSQYSAQHHSVFISTLSSFPNYDLPVCWDQHAKLLPSVKGIAVSEVAKWSTQDVVKFVTDLTGCPDQTAVFSTEEIDGEALLLLTQLDISKVLKMKLGPALKIYNAVLLIKASNHLF